MDSNVVQTRDKVAAIDKRLEEIVLGLRTITAGVEELGTSRPVTSVAEAIRGIEAVRAELQTIATEQALTAVDNEIQKESTLRALSEVNSGEFDMQG